MKKPENNISGMIIRGKTPAATFLSLKIQPAIKPKELPQIPNRKYMTKCYMIISALKILFLIIPIRIQPNHPIAYQLLNNGNYKHKRKFH